MSSSVSLLTDSFPPRFNRPVPPERQDQSYKERIKKEVPLFILKIARAYKWLLHYMKQHNIRHIQYMMPKHIRTNILSLGGSSSVYEYLDESPDYFYDANTKLATSAAELQGIVSDKSMVTLYIPYNTLHENYLQWCARNKRDPYGKKRGADNRSENMIDWGRALQQCYPNAGFIDGANHTPTKVRIDYPRNTNGMIETFIVQNLELRTSVSPNELETIQNQQVERSVDEIDRAMFANADEDAEDVKIGIEEANQLHLMNADGCPPSESVRIKGFLDRFRAWWAVLENRKPEAAKSPASKLLRRRYVSLCEWLHVDV